MYESDNILIEKFITKQLNTEDKRDFEHRLATDKEFSENYRTSLAAHHLITEAGRLELKNKLEEFSSSSKKGTKVIPLWVKRAIPIAALLIIFLGVYQFGLFSKSATTAEMFSDNFEVYASPSVYRSSDTNSQSDWETIVTLYRNAEYEEAIERLSNADEAPQYLVYFYTGIGYMAQGQPDFDQALAYFEKVLDSDNDFWQQASWYKGLSLLKLDRYQEASEVFRTIVNAKSYNYKKAEEILKTKLKD